MNKVILWLFTIFLVGAVAIAEAQQPTKIPRIGFLNATSPSAIAARLDTFRQGLRELGYVEGQGIVIEHRSAEGKTERLPELAVELVRLKVDIIFSTGPQSTRAANEATSMIPIVMGFDNDPVGNGFVASLARPGGNITGLSTLAPEISGKQLELLKEIVPRLSRVAVFGTSAQPGNAQALKEIELAAGTLGTKFQFLDVVGPQDTEAAFRAAGKGRADAVLVLNRPRLQFSANTDYRSRRKEPATDDILGARICGSWGTYDL
jgi:putative ABC transport system substrate-binding protein